MLRRDADRLGLALRSFVETLCPDSGVATNPTLIVDWCLLERDVRAYKRTRRA